MNQERIGQFIAEQRKILGKTQEQFAAMFGVSNRSVSRWETGATLPDLSLLVEIATVLDVSIHELLNGRKNSKKELIEMRENIDQLLEYYQEEKKVNSKKIRMYVQLGVLITFMIASMSCLIVDFVMNGAFGWSLVVVASLVLGWTILTPIIKHKDKWLLSTLKVSSVATIMYLFVISLLLDYANIRTVGVMIAILTIILVWIVYVIFICFHSRILIAFAISVLLIIPLNIGVNLILVSMNINVEVNLMSQIVTTISSMFIAIALVIVDNFIQQAK